MIYYLPSHLKMGKKNKQAMDIRTRMNSKNSKKYFKEELNAFSNLRWWDNNTLDDEETLY